MDQKTLAKLFKTSELPKHLIKSVVQKINGAPVLTDAFWHGLRQDPELESLVVDELRFTARLWELTGQHLPLVRELQRRRKCGEIRHAADLFDLDWQELVTQCTGSRAVGAPPGTPGKNAAQRAQNYACAISDRLDALFPTWAIAHATRLENDTADQALIRFYEGNPELDFRGAGIDAYLAGNRDALAGIADEEKPVVVDRLKRLQRLFRITEGFPGQYVTMQKLAAEGLDSAHSIAGMGEDAFCNKFATEPGIAGNAKAIHARASHRAATALALYAKYSPQYNAVHVAAIGQKGMLSETAAANGAVSLFAANGFDTGSGGGSGGGGPRIPDWQQLFGSLNRCRCEHCRSVLSPSAYLVDLLQLLNTLALEPPEPDSKKRPTALKALLERRPDISRIGLSCANADTMLPYVDLVNEVLEGAVFPSEFVITEKVGDLIANLEKEELSEELSGEFSRNKRLLSKGAQLTILETEFRWLITDEKYSYIINRAGDSQCKLLRVTVNPPIPQTTGTSDDLRANPEHINDKSYHALKTEIFPWAVPFDLWAEEARVYLDHLGVPRHKLMQLFTSEPGKDARIAAEYFGLTQTERGLLSGSSSFESSEMWGFEKSDDSWVDRLSKEPLLLEKTGLGYEQLTDLLAARYVNPDNEIAVKFPGRDIPEQRITTSPWDFAGATIKALDKAALDRFHRFLRLQRKTGWSIREFDKILNTLGYICDNPRAFDDPLLVGLRRISELQKGLGIPLDELLSWFADIDTQPAADGCPSLYDRLFHNKSLQCDDITAFDLNSKRSALNKDVSIIDSANTPVIFGALQIGSHDFDRLVAEVLPQGTESLNLETLSRLYRAASISRALRLSIEDFLSLRAMTGFMPEVPVAIDPTDPTRAAMGFVEAARQVEGCGFSIEKLDYLLRNRVRPQSGAAPDDVRISQLLGEMREGLRGIRSDNRPDVEADELKLDSEILIIRLLATALGLEIETAHQLASHFLDSDRDSLNRAIADYLEEDFVTSTDKIEYERFKTQFSTYHRLHKAAVLIHRFGIQSSELKWLFGKDGFAGVLNPNALPVSSVDRVAGNGFEKIMGMVDLFAVRDRTGTPAIEMLLELKQATGNEAKEAICRKLGKITGWDARDINFLEKGPLKDWTAGSLRRFETCLSTLKTLDIAADTADSWAQPEVTRDVAAAIKQAAKARYDQQRWLELAGPLRDGLREKQRAALVAYLMAKEGLTDSHALYQKYLIDVEMGPRTMTSRTKLAISSVQLFFQRLLMNLEERRIPSGQAEFCKKQWQSLKNYRVWEANRKIFLYPENWIEPDLRKDKTALFRDFESELLQGELTAAAAERALRSYLERLDELARLEICAITVDPATDAGVLHLFGRTRSVPRAHYYRRREKGVWTSWEKLEAGVDGDHLIPVVFDHRLYLFWPEFSAQTAGDLRFADDKQLKTAIGTVQTWDYWELRLAFSQYRQGVWSPKKILDGKLPVDLPPGSIQKDCKLQVAGNTKPTALDEREKRPRSEKTAFTFKTEINDTSVTIRCARREQAKNQYSYSDQGRFRFTTDERVDAFPGKVSVTATPFDGSSPFGDAFHYEGMAIVPDNAGNPLVLRNGLTLLQKTPSKLISTESGEPRQVPRGARLISPPQLPVMPSQALFVYQDDDRTFLVTADLSGAEFENFYHPAAGDFLRRLNRDGLQGLLQLEEQERSRETVLFRLSSEEKTFFEKGQIGEIKKNFTAPHKQAVLNDRGWSKMDNLDVNQKGQAWQIAADEFSCTVKEEGDTLLVQQDAFQQYGTKLPEGTVDFSLGGAYSHYNWELFFHAPLLLADRLSKNQRFEEAQAWFHHIFDPTDLSAEAAPQRYWKVGKFFEEAKHPPIIELLELASYSGANENLNGKKKDLKDQVEQWRSSPFDPHVIARFRISAYQKTVVMKYIDNLIAWGDQLFRQDTIESINEATQLYVLAAEILGKRPLSLAGSVDQSIRSFEELQDEKGTYCDPFIQLEDLLPATRPENGPASQHDNDAVPDATLKLPYFCVPNNDKLLAYWDLVEDRLFKIRHCQNIEGTERQLALFEPPIEPGLLVRAAAAGVDISSALRDVSAPLPHYRFRVMLGKAIELCNDVKALGASFLAALERKDAEGLEQLRMRQVSFDLQHELGRKSIEEANQNVADLEEEKHKIEGRIESLNAAIDKLKKVSVGNVVTWGAKVVQPAVKPGMAAYKAGGEARDSTAKGEEKRREEYEKSMAGAQEKSMGVVQAASGKSVEMLTLAQCMYTTGAATNSFPTVITGGAGAMSSPVALMVTGGGQMKDTSSFWGKAFETAGKIIEAGYEMYKAYQAIQQEITDNINKKSEAEADKKRLEKQLAAASVRVEIAELKKKKIEKAAENAEQIDAYMRSRFTSMELYSWRVSQFSTLYFQTYQMAYDLAKRAEKAFHYELGESDTAYIRFGYWDSLKKGLLAGEQLYFDLRRMEKAYLDQNRRCYEITRQISLKALNNDALGNLIEKGECTFELPETLFDQDYPGHYLRRIKSVNLTVGFTGDLRPLNVNCTLTLLNNSVRMNNATTGGYARKEPDARFRDEIGAVQSIVTSSGRDDSGLFVLDFDDERYLPFEGAGAISRWKIEMPKDGECNAAPATLDDVVLRISYTARAGGSVLKDAVLKDLKQSKTK